LSHIVGVDGFLVDHKALVQVLGYEIDEHRADKNKIRIGAALGNELYGITKALGMRSV